LEKKIPIFFLTVVLRGAEGRKKRGFVFPFGEEKRKPRQ